MKDNHTASALKKSQEDSSARLGISKKKTYMTEDYKEMQKQRKNLLSAMYAIRKHENNDNQTIDLEEFNAESDINKITHIHLEKNLSKSLVHQEKPDVTMPDADSLELVGLKRRREELELLKLEEEITGKTQARISGLVAEYERMCTNTALDEQARLVFKKYILDLFTKNKSIDLNEAKLDSD